MKSSRSKLPEGMDLQKVVQVQQTLLNHMKMTDIIKDFEINNDGQNISINLILNKPPTFIQVIKNMFK